MAIPEDPAGAGPGRGPMSPTTFTDRLTAVMETGTVDEQVERFQKLYHEAPDRFRTRMVRVLVKTLQESSSPRAVNNAFLVGFAAFPIVTGLARLAWHGLELFLP